MKQGLLAAALLLAAVRLATSKDEPANGVRQSVAVASREGKVLVTVTFENGSSGTVYLPKGVAEDDELFGPYFELSDSASGAALAYIGPKVKRAPLGPDDYLALAPKSTHANTIDITQAYAFLPGEHRYRLSYAGTYLSDLQTMSGHSATNVPPVSFTHKPKAE